MKINNYKPTAQPRRELLKASSLSLALPLLESTRATASQQPSESPSHSARAKRLVCIGSNLGFYRPAFYPKLPEQDAGRPTAGGTADYQPSQLLSVIDHHRDDYSVFSGFDHRAGNGHKNWDNYLCGSQVGSISLDQIAAEKLGTETRVESIQLCAGDISQQRMTYSRQGVPLPMVNRPSVIYNKLFAQGESKERSEYLLKSGRSSLDVVREDAKQLQSRVSSADKQKLAEYFQSLRELEQRMGRQLTHLANPGVQVDYELPPYDPVAPTLMLECEQIMLDLIALTLQTDTSRVATLFIAGLGQVFTIDGQSLRAGYHALSHHGNDPDLIRDLIRVETEHLKCFDRFLTGLKQKTDLEGKPLLDSTIVMFGTGMGDASRHSNRDLPTLVAGGGLKHGKLHSADPNADDGLMLGDVYLSMLRQLGIESDSFSGATRGIEGWN
ncbi:MAG: DUF1552 domain-containing protein [Rubripirellula sp.]